MINILICDDDSSFAARLKNLSEQYFSVHGIPAAVSAFSDAEEIGSETFASCDIALLDIDYVSKPYNGLDVARRLRAVRKDAVLIFITNYVEYAPEGYEVRAFRYLPRAPSSNYPARGRLWRLTCRICSMWNPSATPSFTT